MKKVYVILFVFVFSGCKQQFIFDCITCPGCGYVYLEHFHIKNKKNIPAERFRIFLNEKSTYYFKVCTKRKFSEDNNSSRLTIFNKKDNIILDSLIPDFKDGLEFYNNSKKDTFYLEVVPLNPKIKRIVCVVNYVGKK